MTAGIFGLVGALIGGLSAGLVSLRVATQAREGAERAWIRDNRRELYDRFLTCAQELLIASERALRQGPSERLEATYEAFFGAYGVIQTVAQEAVLEAARKYAYRLQELKSELDAMNPSGVEYFESVARQVRFARHDAIDAMRADLELSGSARPPDDYDAFSGTGIETQRAAARKRRESGVA